MQQISGAKLDPLDAHKFIQNVTQQPGAFLEYKLDAQGCLEAVVWALPEQVEASSCIVMCGYKTIPLRHWKQIVYSLPLWVWMATVGAHGDLMLLTMQFA